MADTAASGARTVVTPGEDGPWNPGISSDLPLSLLSLCTIFRKENVFTSLQEATELADLTGLERTELVIFRPERLALHELLVRVTADIEVPDPEDAKVSSLGIAFRRIVQTIHARYLEPRMGEIVAAYGPLKDEVAAIVNEELSVLCARQPPETASSSRHDRGRWWLRRRTEARDSPAAPADRDGEHYERVLSHWMTMAQAASKPLRLAVYGSLAKVVAAVCTKHGRTWGDRSLLSSLATNLACNDYAGEAIGRLIAPLIGEAVAQEGYRLLPGQEQPIVMSTKGASASGKSTMRPLQRSLAKRIGVYWGDFALISPDIFRRSLLDFDSLGTLYKYAGIFTSHELDIVDGKLYRYMARKAAAGATPHLLIDRFRFDSLIPNSKHRQLLSRLARPRLIHYLFMITPPHETVERAWKRGLEIGRYKPVADLLAHNIEAFWGMPGFLLARAFEPNRIVHYEFLDNDVPAGAVPLTVAFGWSGEMNILDVNGMLSIDRYRQINVNATSPSAVYRDEAAISWSDRCDFLLQCVRRFPVLNLADRATGRIYARVESGRLRWSDRQALLRSVENPAARTAIGVVLPDAMREAHPPPERTPVFLDAKQFHTLGRWGEKLVDAASITKD